MQIYRSAAPLIVLVVLSFLWGCSASEDSANVLNTKSNSSLTAATSQNETSNTSKLQADVDGFKVERLVQVEDLVLDLTARLQMIAKWVVARSASDPWLHPETAIPPSFRHLINASGPKTIVIDKVFPRKNSAAASLSGFKRWPLEDIDVSDAGGNPLAAVSTAIVGLQRLKFSVVKAEFDPNDENTFVMQTIVKGKATSLTRSLGFKGKQQLTWTRSSTPNAETRAWQLTGWRSDEFLVQKLDSSIFKDVTESSLPDPATRRAALRSWHSELIDETILTGKTPTYDPKYVSFIDAASPHALPSVSVVDIDQDGWDDLFISARWGPTQLLRNQRDGTFKDIAKSSGLYFKGLVNCSVFVDFDNDGDKDAIIGRSLEPIVYLQNENGNFTDVTSQMSNLGQQYMVSAISVSDINRDGLPDMYLSTYGPFGQNEPGKFKVSADWRDRFLSPGQKVKLVTKHGQGHAFVDNAGPPNVLVMNRGDGRLESVETDDLPAQWHHSYQSAWADVDGDGDDDLYVANDFAIDAFLINETPQGASKPVFSDGLAGSFPEGGIGFGMGVSWGDYDSDGDLDLYVSNMYSKAGKRVIGQIGKGDPRMEIATRGNFLYENRAGKFFNKTGPGPDQHDVGRVGWSYGGQFLDVDNNGHMDLYVPCGYYTASDAADSEVDI